MEPRSLNLKGAHGLDLHLLEWSEEGIPLLLLHGFGNEAHLWDELAPLLAPHYRVLAIDLRGHGDSGWDPEGRYEIDTMVADIEAVTEALAIERLVAIGFSMGGRVVTCFAGRHPERIAGLVLVDIGPEVDPRGSSRVRSEALASSTPLFESVEEYAAKLSLNYPAGSRDSLLRMARFGLRSRADGLFELKMDPLLRSDDAMSESSAEARESAICEEMWAALAKISCPTLIVRGAASDILAPETADKMVDEVLQNGRLAIIPQAAHSVATDNPAAFNEVICNFVLADA